jgi:hypothetical protein
VREGIALRCAHDVVTSAIWARVAHSHIEGSTYRGYACYAFTSARVEPITMEARSLKWYEKGSARGRCRLRYGLCRVRNGRCHAGESGKRQTPPTEAERGDV